MKKLTALFLATVMLLGVSGCTSKKETKTTDPPAAEELVIDREWTELSNCKFRVLECIFTNNITAQDEEYYNVAFSPSELNYIYIDLVLELENTGTEPFGKNDISAYFMYNDLRYDMEFTLEDKNSTGIHDTEYINVDGVATPVDKEVKSGDIDILHMYAYGVEKDAIGEDITVVYTINGEEFEEKVAVREEKDLLTSKTEVKVGDIVDVNGRYAFEVMDCSVKNHIQASNVAESEQYEVFGSGVIADLVIKVINNTELTATKPEPYTIINNEVYEGMCGIEYDNNTKISGTLGDGETPTLEPGSENICHLYIAGIEDADAGSIIIRFNIGSVCYYCKATNS